MDAEIDMQDEVWQVAQACNGEYIVDYTGRGMYGRKCVAIVIENRDQEFYLEQERRRRGLPEPTWDSMGLGAIAYWPSILTD